MNDDSESMTTEEAITCIKHHFTEKEGLLDQIECGQPVDSTEVKTLEVAFQQLHMAWVNVDLVPKQEVQMLWNVIPRLERCIMRYPEREIELSKFMYEVIVWLDQLFMTEVMSEEHAIAVVSQHVIGPSFLKEILLHEKFDATNVDEVFTAVRTLAHLWKKRKYISKLAVGALMSTRYLPLSAHYPEQERQTIQETMKYLTELITRCWE